MSDTIRIEDLCPGDILLHRGVSFVSKGIQLFDGSPVSHASLYLGDGKLGEAVARGLVEDPYLPSVQADEWVKAYRLVNAPADMTPVLKRARYYLDQGDRYGYEQLVFLAVLCTTRKLKITPVLRRLLRTLLDAAATELTALFRAGKEPMICSEFVYRAYDEAEAPNPAAYAIAIPGMLPLPQGGPQMLAAPGAASAASAQRRGVDPESLAALFANPASSAWLAQPASPMASPAPASAKPPRVDRRTLNRQLQSYLEEVEGRGTAVTRRQVSLEELRTSTDRFVNALYQASGASAPAGALGAPAMDAGQAHSAAYDYLFRAAADFVTPRDLYTTESLQLLGTLAWN